VGLEFGYTKCSVCDALIVFSIVFLVYLFIHTFIHSYIHPRGIRELRNIISLSAKAHESSDTLPAVATLNVFPFGAIIKPLPIPSYREL
jgi:hypothetical protein